MNDILIHDGLFIKVNKNISKLTVVISCLDETLIEDPQRGCTRAAEQLELEVKRVLSPRPDAD